MRLPLGSPQARSACSSAGCLREVEWRRRTGEPDVRGRYAVTTTLIDALIEQRPAVDRKRIDTDRADDTVLIVLDQVAITDEHSFPMGRSHLLGKESRGARAGRRNRHAILQHSDRPPVGRAGPGEERVGSPGRAAGRAGPGGRA